MRSVGAVPTRRLVLALAVATVGVSVVLGPGSTGAAFTPGRAGAAGSSSSSPYRFEAVAHATHRDAGSSWVLPSLPDPRRAQRALLHDISCVDPSECTAVGYYATPSNYWYSLVEVRRGSTWRIVATPNRPAAIASVLTGVSCTAPARCLAVGNWTDRSDRQRPLAEARSGARWSISAPPLPRGAMSGILTGIDCVTASWCSAVGWYFSKDGVQDTLVERWGGHAWSLVSSPNVAGAEASTFAAVSCSSPSACMAVGYTVSTRGTTSLAESWNGVRWTMTTTVNPSGSRRWVELDGVSCPRRAACVATGDLGLSSAAPYVALSEIWNGTRWRLSDPVRPRGTSKSPLTGVSCWTPAACVAVGFQTSPSRTTTLAEYWDGATWRVERTPNQAGISTSVLTKVACHVPSRCTAAGYAGNGGYDHPLAATNVP